MAQSVIGALRVNLGLDSAQFEKGARGVKKPLQDMRRQFAAVAAGAAAFGAAMSAAAASGARDIDNIAKAARRLGSSNGGFLALELAADEAGVSLSSLTNDLQTIDREIASIGKSGNAQRALDELGLAAADIEGFDADEKLATIADAIKDLGLTSGETTSVLRDLGVRNREMVLLVSQGGDAIRAARGDIEAYGLAIDKVDSDRIEVANDAISRLGLIGRYAGQQLALELVPALGRMAESMTDSLRAGGLLRTMIDGLADNIQRITTYIGTAVVLFGTRYVAALAAAAGATGLLSGAFVFLKGAIARTGIGLLVVGVGELVFWFGKLVTATGRWGGAMSALGDLASGVWEGIRTSARSIGPALDAIFDGVAASFYNLMSVLTERWGGFLRMLGAGVSDIPGFGGLSESLLGASGSALSKMSEYDAKSQASENSAMAGRARAAAIATSGYEKAAEAVKRLASFVSDSAGDLDEGAAAADRLAVSLDGVADTAQQTADQIQSSFTDAFKGIVNGATSLREGVGNILSKLSDMLLDLGANALFGGVSKSLGGLIAGSIPGFASGTNYAPGGMALVGERGPELINLPRGSKVTPNHRMNGMGGGTTEIIVRNEPGTIVEIARNEAGAAIRQAAPELVGKSVQASQASFKCGKGAWSQ